MRILPILALSAATALLAGCGTPQERTAYRDDPASALAPEYGPGCERLGYGKGTELWRRCIMQSSARADLQRYDLFYDRYVQWYHLRQ